MNSKMNRYNLCSCLRTLRTWASASLFTPHHAHLSTQTRTSNVATTRSPAAAVSVNSPSVPHNKGLTLLHLKNPFPHPGALAVLKQLDIGPNPTYICLNRSSNHIYAVNECECGPDQGNRLSAYSLDATTGAITLINGSECGGSIACHVALSPDKRFLSVAMYGGGSVAVFRVRDDGGIGDRTALCVQEGTVGPDSGRQEASHAHMAQWSPDGSNLLVADLGFDVVSIYGFDTSTGQLTKGSSMLLPAGSGPRHLVFHPSRPFVFVINELLSTVATAQWDAQAGTLQLLGQPVTAVAANPTVKVGVGGNTFCAAIKVSGDGRFVYASNRGHDSISVFAVADSGHLSHVSSCLTTADQESACGKEVQITTLSDHEVVVPARESPRDFALCGKDDEWLVVGNQDRDTVVVLSRDLETGCLVNTGIHMPCPAPACVVPSF